MAAAEGPRHVTVAVQAGFSSHSGGYPGAKEKSKPPNLGKEAAAWAGAKREPSKVVSTQHLEVDTQTVSRVHLIGGGS